MRTTLLAHARGRWRVLAAGCEEALQPGRLCYGGTTGTVVLLDAGGHDFHPAHAEGAVFFHELGGDGAGELGEAGEAGEGGGVFLAAVVVGGVGDLGAEGLGDLDEGLGGEAFKGEGEGAAVEDDIDLGASGVGGDAAGELAALTTGDGAGPAFGGEVGGELVDEVAGLGVEVEAAVEGGADVGGFEMGAGEEVDGAGVVVTLDEGGDEGVDFGEEFEIALAVFFVGFHLALLVFEGHAGDFALEAGLPLFDHAEEGSAGFEFFAGLLDVGEGGAEFGDVGGVARLQGGADEGEVGLVAIYEGAVEGEPFEGGGWGGGGGLPGVGEVLLEVFHFLRAEEGIAKVPFGEAVDEVAEDFFVGGLVAEGAERGAEGEAV